MSRLVGQFRFDNYSPDEITRLCWLRAVEWIAWPAFLSQPLLPILYIYYPVYWVLLGCFWVRLKWLTIPAALFVLFQERRYIAFALTLATPVLVSVLNAPSQLIAAIAQFPSEIGTVQGKFLEQVELQHPSQFTSVG
jgi:hypothetical protein